MSCRRTVAGLRGLSLVGVCAALVAAAPAEAARLEPVSDTTVDASRPHRAFGSARVLRLSASPRRRALLRFDLRSVDGSLVTARLHVYVSGRPRGRIRVRPLAPGSRWSERTAFADAPRAAAGPVRSARLRRGWVGVEVTDLVTLGRRLDLSLTAARARLGSRESSHPPLAGDHDETAAPAATPAPTSTPAATRGDVDDRPGRRPERRAGVLLHRRRGHARGRPATSPRPAGRRPGRAHHHPVRRPGLDAHRPDLHGRRRRRDRPRRAQRAARHRPRREHRVPVREPAARIADDRPGRRPERRAGVLLRRRRRSRSKATSNIASSCRPPPRASAPSPSPPTRTGRSPA